MTQLARIGRLVWAERRPYLIGGIFVATSTVTALAYPYVIRLIIDDAIGGGLLLYTSPRRTLLPLLAVPPIVLATSMLGRRVKMFAADVQQAHAEAGAAATEVLAGIRTVRAFGREPAERARFETHLARA